MAKAKLVKTPKLLIVESLDTPHLPNPLELTKVTLHIDIASDDELASQQYAGSRGALTCEMDYHAASHSYVLTTEIISEITNDIQLLPYNITAFHIENVRADAIVLSANGKQRPWQEAMAKLREYTQPPELSRADVKAKNYTSNGLTWHVVSGFAGRIQKAHPNKMLRLSWLLMKQGKLLDSM